MFISLVSISRTHTLQNIQSTNWQSMRFKPPPSHDSPIGWRVEFRPLDLSLTDIENAAFVVFVVLVSRAILSFQLNFYIPMSKVSTTLTISITCYHYVACLDEYLYHSATIHGCTLSSLQFDCIIIRTIYNDTHVVLTTFIFFCAGWGEHAAISAQRCCQLSKVLLP